MHIGASIDRGDFACFFQSVCTSIQLGTSRIPVPVTFSPPIIQDILKRRYSRTRFLQEASMNLRNQTLQQSRIQVEAHVNAPHVLNAQPSL